MTQFKKINDENVQISDIDLIVHATPKEIIEAAESLKPIKTEAQALADLEA
jgi:hypothetical protein